MAVIHIVVFKPKSTEVANQEALVAEWIKRGKAMVGQIPGLQSLTIGKGLAQSLHRGQGYEYGLVGVLDGPDVLPIYAVHQAHKDLLEIGHQIFEPGPLCVDFESSTDHTQ